MRSLSFTKGLTVALAAALMSASASAGVVGSRTAISKIFITDPSEYGGCMVRTMIDPQVAQPTCNRFWVSLSCDGTFSSKDVAYRKLDLAQMAFALDREVVIYIDDTKQHNGYCFAKRIDIAK